MEDVTRYMNGAIRELIRGLGSVSAGNLREALFLARFKRAHARAERKRSAAEAEGVHIPPFLIASIARACNLKCAGCYARAREDCAAAPQLDAGRWAQIFSEAQGLGVSFILLAGGEPLMRPDVLRRAADIKDVLFPVFTNGMLLDQTWAAFFNRHRNLVPILSIEGDREATDRRRGAGVYDGLLRAMAELKKRNVLFGASVTVSRENLMQATGGAFADFLAGQGCGVAFFVEYVPADRETECLAPDDADRALYLSRLDALREDTKLVVLAFPGDERLVGGCLAAGRGFFHINADGGAEPCPFSPFSDVSVRERPLLEALRSPLFTRLRASGLLQSEHDGGCVLFTHEDEVREMLG